MYLSQSEKCQKENRYINITNHKKNQKSARFILPKSYIKIFLYFLANKLLERMKNVQKIKIFGLYGHYRKLSNHIAS